MRAHSHHSAHTAQAHPPGTSPHACIHFQPSTHTTSPTKPPCTLIHPHAPASTHTHVHHHTYSHTPTQHTHLCTSLDAPLFPQRQSRDSSATADSEPQPDRPGWGCQRGWWSRAVDPPPVAPRPPARPAGAAGSRGLSAPSPGRREQLRGAGRTERASGSHAAHRPHSGW